MFWALPELLKTMSRGLIIKFSNSCKQPSTKQSRISSIFGPRKLLKRLRKTKLMRYCIILEIICFNNRISSRCLLMVVKKTKNRPNATEIPPSSSKSEGLSSSVFCSSKSRKEKRTGWKFFKILWFLRDFYH